MASSRFQLALLGSVAGLTLSVAEAARAEAAADRHAVAEVVVTHAAREPVTAATGLPLNVRDIPQQITVIDARQIRDFGLTDINQLLKQAAGVNVNENETDRTTYNARGFDITNLQMDGVGMPLISSLQAGSLDTVMFDRVEIVKGANAIMTGVGNPSATVNFVRKRPAGRLQGDVAVEVGSWGHKRLEADISAPLNAAGTVRARAVISGEEGDSYLDYESTRRRLFYGVVDWDATSALTLTAGYSRNDSRTHGTLWGSLPLQFSDGTTIDYPVSASTSADWTHWNILDQNTFVEARLRLPHDWNLKASATYRNWDEDAQLLYAYGNPDPVTGLGVGGMSGMYPSYYRQYILDVRADGPFELFGRSHQLSFGVNAARNTGTEFENFSNEVIDYPSIFDWGQIQVPQPTYPGAYQATSIVDKIARIYGAARLDLSDRWKAVVGVSFVSLKSGGSTYGVDASRSDSQASPYAGLIFDLAPQWSLYASYTDIFNPQSELDVNHRRLPPAHGTSYEAGFKGELFDGRLYLTGAVYMAEQADLAETAGVFPDGKTYSEGLDTKVKGYELEAAGRITANWTLNGGFTELEIEGPTSAPIRTYIPRRTLKIASTYAFPELRNLRVGAAVRWQDHTSTTDLTTVDQSAFAVFDLMASVDVTDKIRASINLRNVGDTKYYNSLEWNQGWYGAPRSVTARLDYIF